MKKPSLSLQPSEALVARAACQLYAAYISIGKVSEGKELEWMQRSIREAFQIAKMTDNAIRSDNEVE